MGAARAEFAHGPGREGRPQDILRAALAAGPVREFGPRRPHLADLFKDVVVVAPQEEPRPARRGLFGRRRAA